ncbi:hypothetical protein ABZ707_09970 [Streptomyces sp. NPDC006923]|uniref:hypothetical protein n=1 Tax=Streptomyces sp. NPDC006923 TaxID=3155355 RepID=UPI0033D41583
MQAWLRASVSSCGKHWSSSQVKKHRIPAASVRRRAPAAVYVLALVALAGCTAESPVPAATATATGEAGPGSTGAASTAPVDYTFRLPIAKYSYSDAQNAAIRDAENVLTERCLRTYGIEFQVPPVPRRTGISDRRYGLSNAADAAQYGYHLPPDPPPYNPTRGLAGEEAAVMTGAPGGPTANETLTYRGMKVPAGGCRWEAARSLATGHEDRKAAGVAGDIANESYQVSIKDKRVQDVTRAWSACMKGRGFTYSSPMTALGDPKFLEKEMADGETATAEADIRCKKETDLLNVWFSVESEIQKAMIAKQSKTLDRLGDLHLAKVAAAQKITAGH